MAIKKRIGFLFLCIIWLNGCINNNDHKEIRSPRPIDYKVLEKSSVFNRKNMAFTLDSMDNKLFLHLTINELSEEFPFPINKEYSDTLTKTIFNFDFYSEGKPVLSDYNSLHGTFRWEKKEKNTHLKLMSDSVDLKNSPEIFLEMPYYVFHQLKRGKRSIELHMWQDVFTDRVDIKTTGGGYKTFYLKASKKIFDSKVKFDIEVPAIYQSTIYGQGLVLKNDSTFSPAGMDNTIWKSSYPDIYWGVVYPKRTLYAQTPFEKSTAQYIGLDTFTLYHYFENDSIGFDVYDHDNLSRDDFMGCWWGPLKDLKGKTCADITFGNIKSFKVEVKGKGVINK